ncbi:MAG: hypothetical protein CL678_05110 [Bdellovibrionaceae bacterium]|nr:hypothetical protein [Pseudobdellovibrionaceae bacterium]|tara:strand:+ start:2421 stop:3665 length:1245 start_codon:yes stop_codon:yes gene_type:complete
MRIVLYLTVSFLFFTISEARDFSQLPKKEQEDIFVFLEKNCKKEKKLKKMRSSYLNQMTRFFEKVDKISKKLDGNSLLTRKEKRKSRKELKKLKARIKDLKERIELLRQGISSLLGEVSDELSDKMDFDFYYGEGGCSVIKILSSPRFQNFNRCSVFSDQFRSYYHEELLPSLSEKTKKMKHIGESNLQTTKTLRKKWWKSIQRNQDFLKEFQTYQDRFESKETSVEFCNSRDSLVSLINNDDLLDSLLKLDCSKRFPEQSFNEEQELFLSGFDPVYNSHSRRCARFSEDGQIEVLVRRFSFGRGDDVFNICTERYFIENGDDLDHPFLKFDSIVIGVETRDLLLDWIVSCEQFSLEDQKWHSHVAVGLAELYGNDAGRKGVEALLFHKTFPACVNFDYKKSGAPFENPLLLKK